MGSNVLQFLDFGRIAALVAFPDIEKQLVEAWPVPDQSLFRRTPDECFKFLSIAFGEAVFPWGRAEHLFQRQPSYDGNSVDAYTVRNSGSSLWSNQARPYFGKRPYFSRSLFAWFVTSTGASRSSRINRSASAPSIGLIAALILAAALRNSGSFTDLLKAVR